MTAVTGPTQIMIHAGTNFRPIKSEGFKYLREKLLAEIRTTAKVERMGKKKPDERVGGTRAVKGNRWKYWKTRKLLKKLHT